MDSKVYVYNRFAPHRLFNSRSNSECSPKFELIWMKTETAQALQNLHDNYYEKSMQFISSVIVLAHVLLRVRAMLILYDTFVSYNFAENRTQIVV